MVWELWDPYEEMRKFHKQLERMMESIKSPVSKPSFREPLIDIEETDKEVIAKVELPGVDKKDIDLNITENMVEIKAEKKAEVEVKKKGFYKHERTYAGFQRTFSLPCAVIPEKAEAKLEKGILEITMPKAKPAIEKKGKKIEIK